MLTVDFNLLRIKSGDRVLDVGCGEGRHTFEACKWDNCSVFALDISRRNLRKVRNVLALMDLEKEAKGEAAVIRGDALNLPFKDGSFDKIICSEVLEHLSDDGQGVRELVRVLKDDGALAVTVPTYLTEAIYWRLSKDYYSIPHGHVRKYRVPQLIGLLRKNDLRLYAIRYQHALHSIYWLLRCIFRLKNENALIPSLYYTLLLEEISKKSGFICLFEGLCNYFFPKSIVLYTRKATIY